MTTYSSSEILPAIVGIGSVIVLVTVVANCLWRRKKVEKKPQKLITLADPSVKYQLPLIEREAISHDTRRFRFGLPTPEHVLGLPIGQHVHLSVKLGDDLVIRAYTPVTCDEEKGYFDLVIKIYFKDVHPKFPEGGKMSQYLNNMKLGDTIDVRGPTGKVQYLAPGTFLVHKIRKEPPVKNVFKQLNMIAGGTGLTPMLQLIRHICRDANDHTELRLLYANRSERDILMRNELETLQAENKQFKLWYTISNASEVWQYSTGFVNDEMIREHLFPPSADVVTALCGPPSMVNISIPALERLGYQESQRLVY